MILIDLEIMPPQPQLSVWLSVQGQRYRLLDKQEVSRLLWEEVDHWRTVATTLGIPFQITPMACMASHDARNGDVKWTETMKFWLTLLKK